MSFEHTLHPHRRDATQGCNKVQPLCPLGAITMMGMYYILEEHNPKGFLKRQTGNPSHITSSFGRGFWR